MMFCKCGGEIKTKHGDLCEPCRRERLSHGGRVSAAKINYHKREAVKQAERRTATTAVPVTAKCPKCGVFHTVMLAPLQVERGKTPRIYCTQHEGNRSRRTEWQETGVAA